MKIKRILHIIIISLFLITLFSPNAVSSDKEEAFSNFDIMKTLIELKEGQKTLNQRIEDVQNSLNQRIDDTNQRIDDLIISMNKRFEDMDDKYDQRFEDMNQRFEDMNQRLEDMNQRLIDINNTTLTLYASTMALITALFGYMIWDRRNSHKPLKEKVDGLEAELEEKLDIRNPSFNFNVNLPNQIYDALSILANEDDRVQNALRRAALL